MNNDLSREAAIARGIDAAAEMKKRDEREDLSEQCCGTCLFWDRKNEYTDRARCLWDKPVAFPVSFTRQLTYVEFGNDCPCWQDYKGIVK